jgi:hypothetical protein
MTHLDLALYMRPATLDDLDVLRRWRAESAQAIEEREQRLGLPVTGQWQTPYPQWKLERWIDRKVTWMASADPYRGAPPIATVTLDPEPEPAIELEPGAYESLWSSEELDTSALYMSKLNRAPVPELDGAGIGEMLVRWCQGRAALSGAQMLRIDVWTGGWPTVPGHQNEKLQAWYRSLGFEHVRTVPDVVSGCLMQIPAAIDPQIIGRVRLLEDEEVRDTSCAT